MNKHNVDVDEVSVIPRYDVVGNHEARKLVDVKVPISECHHVSLVLKEKNASKDVGTNRESQVSEVVRGEGNAEKDNGVVDEEGVGTCNSAVEVSADEVLNVNLLKNVEVREGKDAVNADDVGAMYVGKSPNLVHILLSESHYERGVGDEVEGEHDTRPHLADHVYEEREAKNRREPKCRDEDVGYVTQSGWNSTAALTNRRPQLR